MDGILGTEEKFHYIVDNLKNIKSCGNYLYSYPQFFEIFSPSLKFHHSTVTDFAKFLGLSTSNPLFLEI